MNDNNPEGDANSRVEALYRFIVQYLEEHQQPPTLRDVVRARVGEGTPRGPITAISMVKRYLRQLEAEGRIQLREGQRGIRPARGIRVVGARFVLMTPEEWQRLDKYLRYSELIFPRKALQLRRKMGLTKTFEEEQGEGS